MTETTWPSKPKCSSLSRSPFILEWVKKEHVFPDLRPTSPNLKAKSLDILMSGTGFSSAKS